MTSNGQVPVCTSCGAALDAGAVSGQCPRCLVSLALTISSIAVGERLGDYHVLGLLGRGGMGEVYRARDGRLGREVAVKLLPPELGGRADMLTRFEREARVLASLNHPNIATLYGFESDGERRFLVMELVSGETLDQRLARGPLPRLEALRIFRDVARGLAAAHDRGVVHRDLKPSNIALASSGAVKVLDFGLAKPGIDAFVPDSSRSMSPTLPLEETRAGALIGTAAYMSPEQAKGHEVDRRTDVWSFGCCLFESLTGERPFEGDSVAELLAAVLKEEPPWARLDRVDDPASTKLLQRLLVKDSTLRPRDLGDIALEIDARIAAGDDPNARGAARVAADEPAHPSAATRSRRRAWVAGALAAGLALGWAATRLLSPATSEPAGPFRRFAVSVGEAAGGIHSLALSSDGRVLVVAQNEIGAPLLRARLDRVGWEPVAGSESGEFPFFSPDGRSIAFFTSRENHLKKVAIDGGRTVVLAEGLVRNWGGSWSDDGFIVFNSESGGGGLVRVPDGGGPIERLTVPDRAAAEESHRWPQVLPGGDQVLFTIWSVGGNAPQIALYDLRSRSVRRLVAGLYGRFLPSGNLVFFDGRQGMVAPFDVGKGELAGPARPIEGFQAGGSWGHRAVAFADDGLMVRAVAALRRPVWIDRSGRREELESMPPADYHTPSLSHAGDRLAIAAADDGQSSDIWIHDLGSGRRSRLTLEGENASPVWVDDDRAIVFWSERGGVRRLYRRPVDGSSEAEPLLEQPHGRPVTTTPDGRFLATNNAFDIWLVPLDGTGEPTTLLRTEFVEGNPTFSPDGRWFAYISNEAGPFEVYVRPIDGSSGRLVVSRGNTDDVIWSASGREIVYRSSGQVFAAPVEIATGGAAPRIGQPVALFADRFLLTTA
ncbi:MAG TPA: protein kinase, partial [Thermoanaerobaculia bacterium]|nr:protein kinase [Thermoanaerobaculia bacterium]